MAIHIAKTQHKPRVLLIPSAALEPLEQLDVIWQVLNCIEEPIGLLSAEASKKIDVGHAYTEKVIIPLNTRF